MITRHPSKRDLFALAEALAGGRPIDARMAGHVKRCERCKRELNGVRASLEVTSTSRTLEPSESMTAAILARARAERSPVRARIIQRSPMANAVKAVGMAACLVTAAVVVFQTATGPSARSASAPALSNRPQISDALDPERLERATKQIESLAPVIGEPASLTPGNARERELRRQLEQGREELNAALAASRGNPSNERVREVMQDSTEKLAETSKALYTDKGL